jgi:hypothetical protein
MLDAAVKAAKLKTLLDAVLSVEEVGVYKPHRRCISWRWRGSAFLLRQSHISLRTLGMPMLLQPLVSRWCGATVMANAANVCRDPQIVNFDLSRDSQHLWEQHEKA